MNNNKINTSTNINTNDKKVSVKFTEPPKLNEEEKKKLQVKDGQHNHHVDERGGY